VIQHLLSTNYESEIIALLKKLYQNKASISEVDTIALKNYETEDYALLGIIGLLIDNKPRILLGRKQPYDLEINKMCNAVIINLEVLEEVAEKYIDDDFSEEQEVMLEYPKKQTP